MDENEHLSPAISLARNGKSFHWASHVLGTKMGGDAAMLYAFCRLLDDMADGDVTDGPARLAVIRDDLADGRVSDDPAFAAFQPFMTAKAMAPSVLLALIDGLLGDQAPEVAIADEAELLQYAYRVAGTVGLLMCQVLECDHPDAYAHAIDLGIAMQLTNIARDVHEDAVMGRRYLPADWVDGLTPAEIVRVAKYPDGLEAELITAAVDRLLVMADQFYRSGAQGYRYLPPRAHLAIAIAARVYRQIGLQLRRAGCNWHAGRQVTSTTTKLVVSLPVICSLARRLRIGEVPHDAMLHRDLQGLPHVG